jgi:hypothetical protein
MKALSIIGIVLSVFLFISGLKVFTYSWNCKSCHDGFVNYHEPLQGEGVIIIIGSLYLIALSIVALVKASKKKDVQ